MISVRFRWVLLSTVALLCCRCGTVLHGQALPERAIVASAAEFDPKPDEVVLHYYGSGGWGILWRGAYIVAAPYFSNHSILDIAADTVAPKPDAARAGLQGTPFRAMTALLIGHGHIDHAGDVPLLMELQPFDRPPVLVADVSTVHLLAGLHKKFSCIDPVLHHQSGIVRDKCAIGSPQPVARIAAVQSDHAPHVEIRGIGVSAFVGSHDRPLTRLPSSAKDFVLGQTWAFVIDLLDEKEKPVFRIHYVDAAPNAPHGLIALPLAAARDVDVHIGCMPGHDLVQGYPTELLKQNNVRYVIGAHWEDFFHDRSATLKPLEFVLNQDNMESFLTKVEASLGTTPGPVAPVPDPRCQQPGTCGPSGARWAVPVPGQTLRFRVGL